MSPNARCDSPGRRAFTLVELMVAVGILAGMMAMVAAIFSSASKAAGKAQTSSTVHRYLRQATETLRRDLDAMEPGVDSNGVPRAILGIAGVEVSARDRPFGTDYLHRADVLMLVTPREFEPYIRQPASGEVFDRIRHVVYGHANFGQLNEAGDTWMTGAQRLVEVTSGPIRVSQIPASQWHLARRVTGFPSSGSLSGPGTAGWPLTDPKFTGAANDSGTLADVYQVPAAALLDPSWNPTPPPPPPPTGPPRPPPPPGLYKYGPSGLTFYYLMIQGAGTYRYELQGADNYYYLLDSGYWYQRADSRWVREEYNNPNPPEPSNPPPWSKGDFQDSGSLRYWPEWFYTGSLSRCMLDPAPPTGQTPRLAHYFLPGCSLFKIEFTYDDPREIAVGADGKPILFNSEGADIPVASPIRWESVPSGELWVWSGLSVNPSNYGTGDLRNRTDPYRWPRAIRITMRVYGPGGGLDQYIEHTIIHAFQG